MLNAAISSLPRSNSAKDYSLDLYGLGIVYRGTSSNILCTYGDLHSLVFTLLAFGLCML
jgi:hypothetical protein